MNSTFKIQRSNGLTVLFTRSYVPEESSEDENNPNMEGYWSRIRRTVAPHPNIVMPVRQFRSSPSTVYTLHESVVENSAWRYIASASSGTITEKKIATVVAAMLRAVQYLSAHGLNLFWQTPNVVYDTRGDWIEFKLFDFGYSVVDRSFLAGVPLHPLDKCALFDEPSRAEAVNVWNIAAFLYYFLVGTNPYFGLATLKAYMAIMRDGVVFPVDDEQYEGAEDEYDDYSAELKDLVVQMYGSRPEDRIRLADALQHPWILNPPEKYLPRLHELLREKDAEYGKAASGSSLLDFSNVMAE